MLMTHGVKLTILDFLVVEDVSGSEEIKVLRLIIKLDFFRSFYKRHSSCGIKFKFFGYWIRMRLK